MPAILFDDTEERGSAISISRGKKCQAVNIDSIPYAYDIKKYYMKI